MDKKAPGISNLKKDCLYEYEGDVLLFLYTFKYVTKMKVIYSKDRNKINTTKKYHTKSIKNNAIYLGLRDDLPEYFV
jgi:hypothetical protein